MGKPLNLMALLREAETHAPHACGEGSRATKETVRRLRKLSNSVEFYRAEFGRQSAHDKLIPLEKARRILDGGD